MREPYARLADVAKGDTLIADGGFTCIAEGARLVVKEDEGGLFVDCAAGGHWLEGQLNTAGELVGFRKETK